MGRAEERRYPQRSGSRRNLIIAVIAAFALLVGTVGYNLWQSNTAKKEPALTKATERPIGNSTTATGDGVPTDIKSTRLHVAVPLTDKSLVRSQGAIQQITPGGPLSKPLTLRFKLQHKVNPKHRAVFVATRENSRQAWSYQPAVLAKDGTSATVQTSHLSDWWPFDLDLDAMIQAFEDDVMSATTGGLYMNVQQPTCKNEDEARHDDFSITSSSGDTVYWCFGVEDGDRIVRVINNRAYPLQLTSRNMVVKTKPASQWDARHLGQFGKWIYLMPGESATYKVTAPRGEKATIDTEFSGYAQSLYNLDVATDALTTILAKLGTKQLKDWQKYKAMDKLLDYQDCANDVVAKNFGGMFVNCFGFKQLSEVFGFKAALLAPLTAIGSVATWFKSSLNAFGDMWNSRSNYSIVVLQAPKVNENLKPYIGIWAIHTLGAEIKSDGSGHLDWHGFKGSRRIDYTAQFTVSFSNGAVYATVTSSDVTTSSSPETGYYHFFKGERYKLDLQPNGMLAFNATNSDGELIFCGPHTKRDPATDICGA